MRGGGLQLHVTEISGCHNFNEESISGCSGLQAR